MEKIIEIAREIGLLIRDTDIYKRYERAGRMLGSDRPASEKLDRYYTSSGEIETRKKMGDIVEQYEILELESLRDEINRSPVILEYLKCEKEYAELLILIQKEIRSNEEQGNQL